MLKSLHPIERGSKLGFCPEEPYVIGSGKHQGKVLEQMMFTDYSWLDWMLKKLESSKPKSRNSLHQHLEWLLARGEDRKPTMICHFCKERPVAYFSVYYGFNSQVSIDVFYTCCNDENCKRLLKGLAAGKHVSLEPFKFSSILEIPLKSDQKLLANQIFRAVFGLPQRLDRGKAFEFFST